MNAKGLTALPQLRHQMLSLCLVNKKYKTPLHDIIADCSGHKKKRSHCVCSCFLFFFSDGFILALCVALTSDVYLNWAKRHFSRNDLLVDKTRVAEVERTLGVWWYCAFRLVCLFKQNKKHILWKAWKGEKSALTIDSRFSTSQIIFRSLMSLWWCFLLQPP